MRLNDCEINLILAWSNDCVISSAVGAVKFKIADTKLYVPVVTLSTQDNPKLLQPVYRFINWSMFSRSKYTFRFNI